MDKYLLGIDLGTTNLKALLYNVDGTFICEYSAKYPLLNPHDGWFEQRAEDWWCACLEVFQSIQSSIKTRITAICISSQAPSMLPLDENGIPLRPGLIWMDTRASSACQNALLNHYDYYSTYNHQTSPYYLLSKILWYQQNEPELYHKTNRIISTNGYINYRLTSNLFWDRIQAEQITQCFDPEKNAWSEDACNRFHLPLYDLMGEVCNPWDTIGYITENASRVTGLAKGIPVLAGSADGIVAPLAAHMTELGTVCLELGTSAMILIACNPIQQPNCRLMYGRQLFPLSRVKYILSSSVNTAGKAIDWFADICQSIHKGSMSKDETIIMVNALAQEAAAGSNDVLFFPYLSGERAPLWDETLRGSFVGLSLSSRLQDLARSILEGTAFAIRNSIEEAKSLGVSLSKCYVSGGGTKSRLWLQIIASVLDLPLHVSFHTGGAPLADVILAAYSTQKTLSLEDCINQFIQTDEIIMPDKNLVSLYNERFSAYMKKQSTIVNN